MTTEAKRPALQWEKITAISTLVLAIVGLLTLPFAWWQIREFRNAARMQHDDELDAAQVQHIDELAHRWDVEMVGIRKALALKRLDANRQALLPLDTENPPDEMDDVLNFYENMDVMVDHGMMGKYDVWREFSEAMFPFYADARPYVERSRKDNRSLFGGFIDLMENMSEQEKDYNEGRSDHPSMAEVLDFYQGEANLRLGASAPRARARNRHQGKKTSPQ
jgi:hypothetical protein